MSTNSPNIAILALLSSYFSMYFISSFTVSILYPNCQQISNRFYFALSLLIILSAVVLFCNLWHPISHSQILGLCHYYYTGYNFDMYNYYNTQAFSFLTYIITYKNPLFNICKFANIFLFYLYSMSKQYHFLLFLSLFRHYTNTNNLL